jgi:fatty acid synthase
VLPNPKTRSSRWLSTSVAQADWDKPQAALCDAAYMMNNLLSPVLFHEAVALIPKHALVIEISPHCLLQSSIKATVGDSSVRVWTDEEGTVGQPRVLPVVTRTVRDKLIIVFS